MMVNLLGLANQFFIVCNSATKYLHAGNLRNKTGTIQLPPRTPAETLTDVLRSAITRSAKSLNTLAAEAGTNPGQLSRFMTGERDLRLATVDRLAAALGLVLVDVTKTG